MKLVTLLSLFSLCALPVALSSRPAGLSRVEKDLESLRRDLAASEVGGEAMLAVGAGNGAKSSTGGCPGTDVEIFARAPTTVGAAEKMVVCGRDYYVARKDKRGVFLTAYAAVTRQIIADRDRGLYADRAWLDKLLVMFVEYYRRAAHAYLSGRQSSAPKCWRIAFDYAKQGGRPVLADLVAGMAAHIIHDLGGAVHEVGFDPVDNAADYFRVEQSLSAGTDAIIANLKSYYRTNALETADSQLGKLDEIGAAFAMRVARVGAYTYAVSLKTAGERVGPSGVSALKTAADTTAWGITRGIEALMPESFKEYCVAIEREHDPFAAVARDVRIVIDEAKLRRRVEAAQRTWRDSLREAQAAVEETAAEVRENLGQASDAVTDTVSQTYHCSCRSTSLGSYQPSVFSSNCQRYGESRKWCYVRGTSCRDARESSTYRGVYYRYC